MQSSETMYSFQRQIPLPVVWRYQGILKGGICHGGCLAITPPYVMAVVLPSLMKASYCTFGFFVANPAKQFC